MYITLYIYPYFMMWEEPEDFAESMQLSSTTSRFLNVLTYTTEPATVSSMVTSPDKSSFQGFSLSFPTAGTRIWESFTSPTTETVSSFVPDSTTIQSFLQQFVDFTTSSSVSTHTQVSEKEEDELSDFKVAMSILGGVGGFFAICACGFSACKRFVIFSLDNFKCITCAVAGVLKLMCLILF